MPFNFCASGFYDINNTVVFNRASNPEHLMPVVVIFTSHKVLSLAGAFKFSEGV